MHVQKQRLLHSREWIDKEGFKMDNGIKTNLVTKLFFQKEKFDQKK
jgi:hypothetical protein